MDSGRRLSRDQIDCRIGLNSRHRRTAGKLLEKCASLVAEILYPGFACKKTIGGHVAKKRKELNSLTQTKVRHRIVAISNLIEDFFLLLWRTIKIHLAVTVEACAVQPHQPSTQRHL